MKTQPDVMSDTEMATTEWAWTELEAAPRGPEDAAREKQENALRHQSEVEESYRRGVVDGEDAGAQRARNELKAVMSATLDALEEVRANRTVWSERLQEDLTVLAAAMARQIVDRALAEDPELFAELATKAVACFQVEEPVRIRLHPADLDQLHASGTVDEMTEARAVRWVPDEDVVRGGCIVEGPDKIIDGRVDEGIYRLIRTMNGG